MALELGSCAPETDGLIQSLSWCGVCVWLQRVGCELSTRESRGVGLERRQSPTPAVTLCSLSLLRSSSFTSTSASPNTHLPIRLLRVFVQAAKLSARHNYPHGGATSECNCKSRLQPRSFNLGHAFCVSFVLFVKARGLTSRMLVYKHHDFEMCCPCDDMPPINA